MQENILGIPIHPQEEMNPIQPEDWLDDDGLIHCGVCGKNKQTRVKFSLFGKSEDRIVACICDCRKKEYEEQKRQEEHREQMDFIHRLKSASLMSDKFREATFEAYETRPENEKPLRIAKNYVDKFNLMQERNQGILFYGTVGTGKSFTSACIANALLNRGISVVMTSFVKILQDIQGNHINESQYITILEKAHLLIIDDLGAERNTDFALEKVYNIIDSRVRINKPLILTTNLTLKDMQENPDIRYRRIYDRIFEVCYPVNMPGRSFRMNEAARRMQEMKKLMEG